MARDVDEAVLARHVRHEVASGPLHQGPGVGSVDENHVDAHARDDDLSDRLARVGLDAVSLGFERNVSSFGEERGRELPLSKRCGPLGVLAR
jgi:hypothetical protein